MTTRRTIEARVYQQVHFADTAIVDVAAQVRALFECDVHLLSRGNAIAVIWTGVPTPKGKFSETIEDSLRASKNASYIHEFITVFLPTDCVAVWVPASKYHVDLWLAPGETKRRFIRTGFAKPFRGEQKLVYTPVWRAGWKNLLAARCEEIVSTWHFDTMNESFGGESLSVQKLRFNCKPREFSFEISDYQPVAFPWIEPYLRLREELPRSGWPNGMMYTPVRTSL